MFSKEESIQLKKEFWKTFADAYPRKWLLYDTKIKDASFKFNLDNKNVKVMLDIECRDENLRTIYYEKIESLKTILHDDYLPEALFERNLFLDNGKKISRIWVEMQGISMNNRENWDRIFAFFASTMELFERFFYEYEDYIKDLETNT